MRIIVDSCCDMDEEIENRTGALRVPLTVTVAGNDHTDDGTVDIVGLIAELKATQEPARSSCPAPGMYTELIESSECESIVITLSSKLSGSYNAAELGAETAADEGAGRCFVLDSQSASAGETNLLLYLKELIDSGEPFEMIKEKLTAKANSMHTLFVLESLENLAKNGRVNRTIAKIANMLSIRVLMTDDGAGYIKQEARLHGEKKALEAMVELCKKHTDAEGIKDRRLVLSYCNCPERADEVIKLIREQCRNIGEIVKVPTGALSAMYAYDGGIVIAY